MTLDLLNLLELTIVTLLVLILPGAALLVWLPRDAPLEDADDEALGFLALARYMLCSLADALALSLALTAVVGMFQFFTRVTLSGWVVVSLYALCLLALIGGWLAGRVRLPRAPAAFYGLASLLVLAFLALILFWRFEQARSLVLPAWVDPVHHTLLVRKILEYGGLPPDYLPYIPAPFFYHYGFHLITALFSFWSSVVPADAVLWVGQGINAAAALAVFRAVDVLDRHESGPAHQAWGAARAFAAALLVAFCFQMPAYYLTWGRFTLLSGLLLLGPLAAAAVEAVQRPDSTGARIRLAFLVAGMCMTHYFALGLAVLFLFVLGLSRLPGLIQGSIDRVLLLKLIAWAVLGLLIAAPWLIRVWVYNQQDAAILVRSPFDRSEETLKSVNEYLTYLLYLIGPRRSHILLGAAGFGLIYAFLRKSDRVLAGWAVLLAVFALPWGVRFDPFRPDHFAIILFFPAAILLASLLTDLVRVLAARIHPGVGAAAWGLIIAGLVVWGSQGTHNILNPVTVYVTPADRAALDWVQENTPPDARFYLNSTRWVTTAYRGLDGAYWLTPYTGRATLIPPIFYLWSSPEYYQLVTNWGDRTSSITTCSPEFWNIVVEAQLTHVYLREGSGSLQPAGLQNCPGVQTVYNSGGVFIYEVFPP